MTANEGSLHNVLFEILQGFVLCTAHSHRSKMSRRRGNETPVWLKNQDIVPNHSSYPDLHDFMNILLKSIREKPLLEENGMKSSETDDSPIIDCHVHFTDVESEGRILESLTLKPP
jgi:hypothetical protein